MGSMTTTKSPAEIFARVIDVANGNLAPDVAQHILQISFAETDQARMHELLEKNRDAGLTLEEQEELDSYNLVGNMLAIWHSKARKTLKQSSAAS